jgi:colicin import membrane protein
LSTDDTAPEPALLERYGSRSNLYGSRNDFDYRSYDPEFHLPSRIRFRETTELVPKLAVLPLRTRVTFSEPLPPTQIIESIAHASTKNQLSSTDKVKSSSPVNEIQKSPAIGSPTQNSTKKEKEENIWDRITHIEPTPIATVTAEPTRTSRPDSKSRLSDSSSTENRPEDKNRLGDELEKMRKELERVKRENQEKDQLLKQAKLEKLAKTTSQDDKIRSDSCETEIFSTPPSSPQPPINSEKKSTQTNYSSKSSTSETDENELLAARLQREEKFRQELEAELQRQKAESSKAADLASKQRIEIERQNAEIQKLKERLTLSQSNHETDRRRLEDETRVADRLKETNAQLTQDLETERNRFNEVRNDLQVAIDSISARGPYINMDMPLNDLETRILHNIRLNT